MTINDTNWQHSEATFHRHARRAGGRGGAGL